MPAGSVMLCVGMGAPPDDLAAELLVRVLRQRKIDARHFSIGDLAGPPSGASPDSVGIVYLVSAFPSPEREHLADLAERLGQGLPNALLVSVLFPGMALQTQSPVRLPETHHTISSFGQALQIALERQQTRPEA